MNIFTDIYPDFINKDTRTKRVKRSYQISADFMNKRYQAMLPEELIKDKVILDIGCFLGAAGAWALHHGARRYIGTDISNELTSEARCLFEKYFVSKSFNFITLPFEELVVNEPVDIIIFSGIIYAFTDPNWVVEKLAAFNPSYIIVESNQPTECLKGISVASNDKTRAIVVAKKITKLEHILRETNIIAIGNYSTMVAGLSGGEHLGHKGCLPSMQALAYLFMPLGFELDLSLQSEAEKTLTVYNFKDAILKNTSPRFIALFRKGTSTPITYYEMLKNKNLSFRKF